MNAQTLTSPVAAALVSDAGRMLALPRHFGAHLLEAETTIFAWLRELSADYEGGYLHFYELSNGGFYMAPDVSEPFQIEVVGNGYRGRINADAAGITACLFAYSHLSFRFRGGPIGDHYPSAASGGTRRPVVRRTCGTDQKTCLLSRFIRYAPCVNDNP